MFDVMPLSILFWIEKDRNTTGEVDKFSSWQVVQRIANIFSSVSYNTISSNLLCIYRKPSLIWAFLLEQDTRPWD